MLLRRPTSRLWAETEGSLISLRETGEQMKCDYESSRYGPQYGYDSDLPNGKFLLEEIAFKV